VVSVLGSLAGLIMAAPRVYYALARDGLFAPGLAAIHPLMLAAGRPKESLLGLAIVSLGLPVYGVVFPRRSGASP